MAQQKRTTTSPPLQEGYRWGPLFPSSQDIPKRKKRSSPKKEEKPLWDLEELFKKQKLASEPAYLISRLQKMQKLRTRLIKEGNTDKALLVQQGIQKLQLRIERIKRERRKS